MNGQEEAAALDPAGVIAALKHHGVRYVIVGGVAAQLHGSPAPTRGLDVTPERSAANLARLAAALSTIEAKEWVPGFGYPLQLPMDRRRLEGERVLLTQSRHGRVDVVPAPHGVPGGYDEMEPRARLVGAYGATVAVASLDDLVRSHTLAGRAKDKLALSRLIDLRLRHQDEPSPPYVLTAPEAPPTTSLHDALAAAERLAVVFDVIRPQVAYVRRELYRAIDSVTYGEEAATRSSIGRAQQAASNAQLDVQRLLAGDASTEDRGRLPDGSHPEGYPAESLAAQADQELLATLRLLTAAAARRDETGRDDLHDSLIEARVHAATADNHLDQLQVRLEHIARAWEREPPARGDARGRE